VLRTAVGAFALVAAVILLLDFAILSARADTPAVWILVVKEHGVGSPTMVQPYLDRFVAIAAEQNGWADAKGQYYNNRSAAEAFIQGHHPHYGIFSLPVSWPCGRSTRSRCLDKWRCRWPGGGSTM
jgi:hypothetical protein